MIARVRIAPVERWCEAAKQNTSQPYPTEVPILTHTCREDATMGCDGRFWEVDRKWAEQRFTMVGKTLQPWEIPNVCEHMLEMD